MRVLIFLAAALLAAAVAAPVAAQTRPAIAPYQTVHHPVYGRAGMVASQNATASQIGADVLADGGNAVDAAVAIGFALAVTVPRAGNIGGGGFMLVHDAESGETKAIDYRETAPLGASREMFLDAEGNADPQASRFSHRAAGVPGTVAGLFAAHEAFGRLPWKRLVTPAARLARDGTLVTKDYADQTAFYKERLCRQRASCNYFFKDGGEAYAFGERRVQADLAWALELIAEQGAAAFYEGEIADKIVAEMENGDGLIDSASLAAYTPEIREALRGEYRGYEIVAMPPPSSGGVAILQMLNILEHFPVGEMGAGSADSVHLLAEVMRLAYADRSKHLGDPDFYPVPLTWLTSKAYAAQLAETIDMQRARPSAEVSAGVAPAPESMDTTHYTVIDAEGNIVSNTYTLNLSYGSGISVSGAGFLLNNEMDDFVSKPGVPNAYGLAGGEANAVEARKRPLSSMVPVIVLDEGRPWFATGSPGGSRIITTVLQMIVNMIDYGMNLADATDQPRMHHQWYPDRLFLETGFGPDTIKLLEERGHIVNVQGSVTTSLQSVAYKDGLFRGASDPRRPNAAAIAPPAADAAAD
ncbi:MAG TPA: gamma-glutamyltransferase [Woeseiaceae bacterium]|nr:gamma-glutamyltransferase [Woeseiaceae bacterium]